MLTEKTKGFAFMVNVKDLEVNKVPYIIRYAYSNHVTLSLENVSTGKSEGQLLKGKDEIGYGFKYKGLKLD